MSLLTRLTRLAQGAVAKFDGWSNSYSGLGTSRDRHSFTTFSSSLPSRRLLADLYKGSRIARRIVVKPVHVALSKGVTWTLTKDDPSALAILEAEVKRTGLLEAAGLARRMARLYGGALLVAATAGAPGSAQAPLGDLVEVEGWRVFTRHQATLQGGLWRVTGSSGQTLLLHPSRVLVLQGEELPIDEQQYERWGLPVLCGVIDALADAGAGVKALSTQLHESNLLLLKVKGLRQIIASGRGSELQAWIEDLDLSRSVLGALLLDADQESAEVKTRPLKDAVEVLEALRHEVAAAADIPMHELYGKREGGLGASEIEATRKWYDAIDQGERVELRATLLWGAGILARQPRLRRVQVDLSWPSLWTPTDKEQAETRKISAEIRKIEAETARAWIDAKVLTPEQVATPDLSHPRQEAA